jgi:diketogulonate reductase-like aldo/keto reductase
MSRLLAFAAVPPAVNQVELNVGWRQEKVREVCAKNGVVVTAFSPLGAFGSMWGSNAVMESGVLQPAGRRRQERQDDCSGKQKIKKQKGKRLDWFVFITLNQKHFFFAL